MKSRREASWDDCEAVEPGMKGRLRVQFMYVLVFQSLDNPCVDNTVYKIKVFNQDLIGLLC